MTLPTARTLVTIAAATALALGGTGPAAFAKHGADDPAAHHVNDDHGAKRAHHRAHRHGHGSNHR